MVNVFFTIKLAPGVYDIPALHAVGKGVFTNTAPVHPYRGAGRPEATYLIERLLDRAAAVARHRSGRNPPPQFHPRVANAAQDRDRHHLRQRRFRACHGRVPQACGLVGFRQARRRVEEERQAARPRALLLPGRGVGLQRSHGAALRSERDGDDPCRHAFARPGPRHRLRADGAGMARRAVREHPLRAGRHRRGAVRPRHLWLAQHAGRRQRAEERRRRHHRQGASRWRRI